MMGSQGSRQHTAVRQQREANAGVPSVPSSFQSLFYLCASSHVCAGAFAHVLVKARVRLRCHSLGALGFELGPSVAHGPCKLGQAVVCLSLPPRLGIASMYHHAWLFMKF